MDKGFIKIHRKFIEWEWYDSINTKILFLHLLLRANHIDKYWRNVLVKRGQLITSIGNLAHETSLTPRKIRTSLSNLKKTNEIDIQTTNEYTLITICNYNTYQDTKNINDKQTTNKRQLLKNIYNNNNNNKQEAKAPKKRFIPPTIEDVQEYVNNQAKTKPEYNDLDCGYFIDYYESKGWMVGKNKMKDWKAAIRMWIRNQKEFNGKKINRKTSPKNNQEIRGQRGFEWGTTNE